MDLRAQYERAKARLLADASICADNRAAFATFFEFEEYKLKRQNGLADVDDGCCKTLYNYIVRLRNVNRWFDNKPWKDLTTEDVKRVYDGLEDGTILTRRGAPVQNRASYYNKILKGKPFRIVGKDQIARTVIEFTTEIKQPVRFVTEEVFRRITDVVSIPQQLLLLWLAWDVGENIDTLLKLTPRDFIRQSNRYTNEPEYLINLPASKIKRSRQTRSEVTLYPETVRFADLVVPTRAADATIFTFEYRQASKFLTAAVRRARATTMPDSQPVRWKDLRSGMACHLLRNGWSRDEVNARLGHTPHSDALDRYINFLALDRERPKQRMTQNAVDALQLQLADSKRHAQLASERLGREELRNENLTSELQRTRDDIASLRRHVERLAATLESADP